MKKAKIENINLEYFKEFINRLRTIDNQIHLKLDNNELKSNVYAPGKSLVKSQSTDQSNIFQFKKNLSETIKMGFYDGKKLLDYLKELNPESVLGELVYSEDDDEDNLAKYLLIRDNQIKIKIGCVDEVLSFLDIPDDKLESVFSDKDQQFKFNINSNTLKKIDNLSRLDSDDKIWVIIDEEGLKIGSKSYQILIDSEITEPKFKKAIYKTYFQKLDKAEDYQVVSCENRILFYKNDDSLNPFKTNVAIIYCQQPDEEETTENEMEVEIEE